MTLSPTSVTVTPNMSTTSPAALLQPLIRDDEGTIRFRENALVRHLLDWATSRGCGMNELAMVPVPVEDREQFASLIGYSLSGFSELSYVRDSTYEAAAKGAEHLS